MPLIVSFRNFGIMVILVAALVSPASPPALAAPALHGVTLPSTLPILPNPILFVTQVPTKADFQTVTTTFSNQEGGVRSAARGGDLWIRYTDGTLKNLTLAGGYGTATTLQDASAIAVRDPAVNWDGTRALFSMVIGAPISASQIISPVWQLYEVSGFAQITSTVMITRVANQPAGYNNLMPAYGADDHILFISDRPRAGSSNYPLLDEYNMFTTNTGLWNLDPQAGDVYQMDANPSGDFTPFVDSYGRIVFTRWDHLERDQETDADALSANPCKFCTFNYASEALTATKIATNTEVYPEPRPQRIDLLTGTNVTGHHMNEFLPWTINADGTGAETLNHIGRHELLSVVHPSFTDDPNLVPLYYTSTTRYNHNYLTKFMQIREDPAHPGTYYGLDDSELVHDSGQVISMTAPPGLPADQIALNYVTIRDTYSTSVAAVNSTGHYRNPLPLSDGTLIAARTVFTGFESLIPPYSALLNSKFDFQLWTLVPGGGGYWTAGVTLTTPISESVSFWYSPTLQVSYSGNLWELDPVEVAARPRPAVSAAASPPAPEQSVFLQAGVTITALKAYLTQNNLALAVTRNVTTRDHADQQQPFRLQVGLTGTQTLTGTGQLYHVSDIQFFQADQLRGLGGLANPLPGRRVLAEPLHDPAALAGDPPNPSGPPGSMVLAPDGSMAAFVPAQGTLSWQLTDAAGTPVVRERMWVSFQPGEIRVCTSCHGLNQTDQTGAPAPTNPPQALLTLLQYWQSLQPSQGPQFTSPLSAHGTVGQPFSYTLAASGSGPIIYTTSALPAGLIFASPLITGTPSISGTTPVTLTANNGGGHASQILSITIQDLSNNLLYLPALTK